MTTFRYRSFSMGNDTDEPQVRAVADGPCTVMIVDDDPDDCFFHERSIRKVVPAAEIVTVHGADDALAYLRGDSPEPDIILLDINMPRKSGWDFLDEFESLDSDGVTRAVVIMLTSSQAPRDVERANGHPVVKRFTTKPLDEHLFIEVLEQLRPS